ncbi:MAG: ABC transporter ATP-binding protein [Deinococcota bacterium]|jgi:putative ABC transport system ATP-binding protein|nr:ABC transporter ATP-binding protein [Deinococcota bacterium]
MIELEEVWKTYTKGQEQIHALRGVTLHIRTGEKVALVGPSGAGKSTLLYLIGLMDLPTRGKQRLLGENPLTLSDRARSRLRGRTIGFVFQSFNLIPQFRAWENVALPLRYAGVGAKERKERALAMLEEVGLLDRAEHYPNELSGGQEQRVAIARALVIEPKLVLADEPTGNLDTASGERVLELLDGLHARGMTLVTVTHSPEVAKRAQRVVKVVDGQVVEDRRA